MLSSAGNNNSLAIVQRLSCPSLTISLRRILVIVGCVFTLCLLTHNANADWVVKQSRENLHVFSEFNVSTDLIQSHLQDIQQELASTLGLKTDPQRVEVILFSSSRNYKRYLANRIPEGVNRRAIFYRNNGVLQIYAFRSRSLITDLRHELTHALLHSVLPYVPLWIDEGLAEYFEETRTQRRSPARLSGVKWKARFGWNPDLRELEQIPAASKMTGDDYRDSWAMVYFLMNESERSRKLVAAFLQAISAGEAPGNFSDWSASRGSLAIKGAGSYFRQK